MGNTKEEILTVALHLFARDGYEAVSVSRIAGELGMTKGALYRHYQNKRDIFEHIDPPQKKRRGRFLRPPDRLYQTTSKTTSWFKYRLEMASNTSLLCSDMNSSFAMVSCAESG